MSFDDLQKRLYDRKMELIAEINKVSQVGHDMAKMEETRNYLNRKYGWTLGIEAQKAADVHDEIRTGPAVGNEFPNGEER